MFAFLLAAALVNADHSVAELARETFRVPPRDYRYIPIRVANWPATLFGTVEVASGPPVRVELIAKADLDNFIRGRSHSFLLDMRGKRKAEFRQALPEKGEYEILLVNEGTEASDLRLEALAQFAREPDVARYLSPERRLTVISISLLCFLAIASWSTIKLLRAMKKA